MLNKVLLFVKYNNAFTIILGMCFLSVGVTFASPTVRETVYSSEETVTSIDNKLILQADLDNFNFNLKIDSITDDQKNYYINYSYNTIALIDSVWQDQKIEKILTVSKEALDGKDLGLYVGKELADNVNYELSYLKRVQVLEKEKGESKKIVTVEYSGLIGKLLDPKEKVIEGYDPVIPEPIPSVAKVEEADPQAAAAIIPIVTPKKSPEVEKPKSTPESTGEATATPETTGTTTPEVTPETTPDQSSTPTEEATTTPETTETPATSSEPEESTSPEPEQPTSTEPEPEEEQVSEEANQTEPSEPETEQSAPAPEPESQSEPEPAS